ncbi:MAG: CDP-diacylglycerol--serine O-phosphatidyltransferase [Saprospiraceae bacterium]|nr:CDP-diacylglycerol--serine O-phosphatidyltransferase [Saprospiraceae bacterium]
MNQIPNALTLLNVFCGSCALVSILNGRYTEGVYFLVVCLIADFLDGFTARLLNVKSEMGKELDSLADMVSFGVVPAAILYKLLTTATVFSFMHDSYYPLLAFVITAFSCYRLAKFNLDTRQSTDFIGLNTPTNTLFYVGLLFIKTNNLEGLDTLTSNATFLYALIPISSYLLISEIPMFSLKIKGFQWAGNQARFIFAGLAVVLLALIQEAAIAPLVVLYVVVNVVSNMAFAKTS